MDIVGTHLMVYELHLPVGIYKSDNIANVLIFFMLYDKI